MTDDRPIEERLATAFRSGPLPAAPVTLLAELDAIAREPVTRRAAVGGATRRRRPWVGGLAVAAMLALGGVLAFSIGGRENLPVPTAPPSLAGSLAPTAEPFPATRLEFAPQWTAGVPAETDTLAGMVAALQYRLDSAGITGGSVASNAQGRIVVDLPAGTDVMSIRAWVAQTGEVAFVPIAGASPPEMGDVIDGGQPPVLVSVDVASASVGQDQNGAATLDIKLTEDGGARFGVYTRDNVGSYVAITLDRVVVSAPVINSEIPGGEIQIAFGVDSKVEPTEIARLAATIDLGPLPVPLVEVAAGTEVPVATNPPSPDGAGFSFIEPFAYQIPPTMNLRLVSHKVEVVGWLDGSFSGTQPSLPSIDEPYVGGEGRGILFGSAETAWSHGLRTDDPDFTLRPEPRGFLADLRDLAGLGVSEPVATTFDERPALSAAITPGPGSVRGIHVNGPQANTRNQDYIALTAPSRIIVTEVAGSTVFALLWAPTETELATWLLDSAPFMESVRFVERP